MIPFELCADADSPYLEANLTLATVLGVARIELCADMANDGTTPSRAAVALARSAFPAGELLVMVRPRPGNFVYHADDIAAMLQSIDMAAELRADGVVIGVLRKNGELNYEGLNQLVSRAKHHQLKVTFHRAFDALSDPQNALTTLLSCGVDRVLTCGIAWGQPGGALDGIAQLNRTIAQGEGRIETVIGGGVTADNLPTLIAALSTTIKQQAGTSGASCPCISIHAHSAVLVNGRVDEAKLSALIHICNQYNFAPHF